MRTLKRLELVGVIFTVLLAVIILLPMTLNAAGPGTLWSFSLDPFHPTQASLGFVNISDVKSFDSSSSGPSLYLKNDGTVWASGSNTNGELGIGNTTNTCTSNGCPIVQVHGAGGSGYLTDIIAVSSGGGFSLALKSDNTVWAWGSNYNGRLGVGSASANITTPTQVVGPNNVGFLTGITAISAGWDGSCGGGHILTLKSDNTVWAWGNGGFGQLGDSTSGYVCSAITPFPVQVQTSSGPLTNVKSISAANLFSLALKNDGTVWSWGINASGNLGIGTTTTSTVAQQVHGENNVGYLTGIDQISARGNHCMAYRSAPSGIFYTWGQNIYGALCDGTTVNRNTPVSAGILPACTDPLGCSGGTVAIAAGTSFSLIKNPGGTISACGRGFGTDGSYPSNYGKSLAEVPLLHDVTAIAAGYAAMALGPARSNSTVQIQSSLTPSVYGQTVTFTATVSGSGAMPTGTVSVSTNGSYYFDSAPLDANGTASYAMNSLQVGNDQVYFRYNGDYNFSTATASIGQQVNKITTSTALVSSPNPSLDTDSVTFTATVTPSTATGTVNFYDGSNLIGSGSLVNGTASSTVPNMALGTHKITVVYAGDTTRAGSTSPELTQRVKSHIPLTISGTPPILVGADDAYRFLPTSTSAASFSITKLPDWATFDIATGLLSGTPAIEKVGTYAGIVISATDGYDTVSLPPFSIIVTPQNCPVITVLPATLPIGTIGAPFNRTVTASGGAEPYSFAMASGVLPDGLNFGADGTLNGTPTKTGPYSFSIIATDSNRCAGSRAYSVTTVDFSTAPKLAAGGGHSIALKKDGTLLTWGLNNFGQLGTGDNDDRYARMQIGSDTDWVTVAAGEWFSIALKSDGTLWAWGNNWFGQLGMGNGPDRNIPVQVGSENSWAAVATGLRHTLALKADGTLWSWGNNDFGQLGRVTNDDGNMPVQVGSETTWKSVAAGGFKSLAVKTDGTLWAFGREVYDFTDYNSPVQIGSDKNWKSAVAGGSHLIALKTDGTLWAWGTGSNGQLGGGNNYSQQRPVPVGVETDWKSVVAGENHSMALKTNGTLWTWGRNANGQLGIGDTGDRNIPVPIGSDTDWSFIAAGQIHSLAMKTDGSMWAWGSNGNGRLGTGDLADRSTPSPVVSTVAKATVTLMFDQSGTGSGTMTEPTLGISCGGNCYSDQMLIGTQYTFTAAPSQYAFLYSLTGPNCSTVNSNCTFTPTGDVTITARFDHDTAHQVYNPDGNGQGSYYSTLQAAYDAAAPGSTVMAWSQEYSENLSCTIDKSITLRGGYDQAYTSSTNWTTLNGIFTIGRGSITINGVAVK